MTNNTAISVKGLHKNFKLPIDKNNSIKGSIINFRKQLYQTQETLRGITFDIKKGEFFGIVGRNGSGKSTLLKVLAGIYYATNGNIKTQGKIVPFIELGVGFNPELSGRDNVFLNGALLGFTRSEMDNMYDSIVGFAELEQFMDQKLKNYSSGMQVRLAFSIAIRARGDILLLDEVLAVGDAAFQKKCFDYFRELKKQGQTVVFISHDMGAIREFCTRALLIEKGKILHIGNVDDVADQYTELFNNDNPKPKTSERNNISALKNKAIVITKVSAEKVDNQYDITAQMKCNEPIDEPVFGFTLTSPIGIKIIENNTKWLKSKTGKYKKGETFSVHWVIPDIFTNGKNTIDVAVTDASTIEQVDTWEGAVMIYTEKNQVTSAVTLPGDSIHLDRS